MKAYALIKPASDEAPAYTFFGWPLDCAERFMLWAQPQLPRTQDEIEAAFEVLRNPQIDKYGYKLVDAHTVVVREAAWACDLEDVQLYYEGPPTVDEYAIRQWVEVHTSNLGTKHALLELLAEVDRELDDPDLVRQIAAQLDEDQP